MGNKRCQTRVLTAAIICGFLAIPLFFVRSGALAQSETATQPVVESGSAQPEMAQSSADTKDSQTAATEQSKPAQEMVTLSGSVAAGSGSNSNLFCVRAHDAEPSDASNILGEQVVVGTAQFSIAVPKGAGKVYLEVLGLASDGSLLGKDAPRGLYAGNPVVLDSPVINNLSITVGGGTDQAWQAPRASGSSVVISGTVIFDSYSGGPIRINADKTMDGPNLGWVEIAQPGPYTLEVPADAGTVYVRAINIKQRMPAGARSKGYRGGYSHNPVSVGASRVENVDIVLENNLE